MTLDAMRRAHQVVFAPDTRALKVGFGLIYEVVPTPDGGVSLLGPGDFEVLRVTGTSPDDWTVEAPDGTTVGLVHRVGGGLTFALSEPDGTPAAVVGSPEHLERLREAPRPPRPSAGESIWLMLRGGVHGTDPVEPAPEKLDSYAVYDARLQPLQKAARKLAILSASYRYGLDFSSLPPSIDRALLCGVLGYVAK